MKFLKIFGKKRQKCTLQLFYHFRVKFQDKGVKVKPFLFNFSLKYSFQFS